MMDLPQNTHRHLVQPLANGIYVKQVFASRFLKFCENLKISIRDTFKKVKFNIKATTGNNLPELGELLNKPFDELIPSDASNIVFAKFDDANKYRINFIKEIIDVKHGALEVNGFSQEELEEVLDNDQSNL